LSFRPLFFLELNKNFLCFSIYAQICSLRAGCTRASPSVPRVSSAATKVVERASYVDRIAAATITEIVSVPSDFESHADTIPRSQIDSVRLRQIAVAGSSIKKAKIRKSSGPHIYADD